tara:strand:- start:44 stop:298 length:255 start_codon:yes stop_codon:yes gene_type:complete
MSQNKEDLKNKIIYRASYRGTKEMDILMISFVNSLINKLEIAELQELSELVNLDDEILKDIKYKISKKNKNQSNIIKKFQEFNI